MITEKFYSIKYIVEGSGRFPFDMLRYDRAVPATESDSNSINREHRIGRMVELIRFSSAGKSGPCVARWASFGWKVVRIEYPDGSIETAADQPFCKCSIHSPP
jgi:hypothetical protein